MRSARTHTGDAVRRSGRLAAVVVVALLTMLSGLMGAPAALAEDCKSAPPVDRPSQGMVGTLDPAIGNGAKGSVYLTYGYAGTQWHTFDIGTVVCFDAEASTDTQVGNFFFNTAKVIVGATNAAYWQSMDSGSLWVNFDGVIESGSRIMYQGFTLPFLSLALLLVAVALFKYTLAGNLAKASTATGRVALGLWVASAVFLTPLTYATITDGILVSGVEELRKNLLEQAGIDYSDGIPTMLYDQVVWNNWQRGEFGSETSPAAEKFARDLIDAQAWTVQELADHKDGDQAALDAKRAKFVETAKQIKETTSSYEVFTGQNASRAGTGFFALVQAACFALFQLFALAGVFLAQALFRLGVLLGPALGLLMFAPGVGRTVGRAIGGALVQGGMLVGGSVVHAILLHAVLRLPLGTFAKLLTIVMLTILMWQVFKPIRRLRNMVTAAAGLPLRTRHEDSLEDLLKRQGRATRRGQRRGMFERLAWWLTPQHEDSPDRGPVSRPEVVHDAELVDEPPRTARAGRDVEPRWRRGPYIDAEAWTVHEETSRRDPGDRAEALPRVRRRGPRPDDPGDPSAGRPPHDDTPPNSGSGGGGTRAETRAGLPVVPIAELPAGSSPSTSRPDTGEPSRDPGGTGSGATFDASSVSDDVVVPSRMAEQESSPTGERWRDAETGDGPPVATHRGEGDQEVWEIYRPATDQVEQPGAHDVPRPEATQGE
jgi:hypothetical protein